jgi:hypothetical protein
MRYNQTDVKKNVNCSKPPRHRATDEVQQKGKDGLDMQGGWKEPQTAVVKNFLEANRIEDSQIW